jgi:hypothetical protein
MDIEIVEFYPIKTQEGGGFTGSLHVYLIEQDIDIRGIYVKYDPKKPKAFLFLMPAQFAKDSDGKATKFPIFQFANHCKNTQLKKQIEFRAIPYIQKNHLGMDVMEPPKAEKRKPKFKPQTKDLWNRGQHER